MTVMNWLNSRAVQVGCLSILAMNGCAGGASTSAVQQPGATSAATGTAQFVIRVPVRTPDSQQRQPAYVSPSTQSVTIAFSTASNTVNLTSASPACSTSASGLTCTINVNAAAGLQTFSFTTFDQPNGGGNQLSTVTLPVTVVPGTTTPFPVVMNGIAASAVLTLSVSGFVVGTSGSATLTIAAKDVDNNTIVGPGSFTSPITIFHTDQSGSVTLSQSSVTAPGQTIALTYSGSGSYTGDSFTAKSAAGATISVAPATLGATQPAKILIVANNSANTVTLYNAPYLGAPSGTISNGVSGPQSLALDAAGNLFVANIGANTVTEYAPPYTGAPLVTIGNSIRSPRVIKLDSTGNLFVMNCCNQLLSNNNVTVYAPPYTGTPVTISNGVSVPQDLAVNAAGNLFVGNCGSCPGGTGANSVTQYAPPFAGAPVVIINTGTIGVPQRLALDAAGNLFAAFPSANTVAEYAPPYTGAPIANIKTGLNIPLALTLDATGNLFVGNCGTVCSPTGGSGPGNVVMYAPPYSGTPAVVSSSVSNPFALLADSSRNVFIANCGSVCSPGGVGGSGSVTVNAPPYTGTPVTITNGVTNPTALILK